MTKTRPSPAAALLAPLVAQPYVLLTLAPLFWSGNTIASKFAVGEIEPLAFTALRWIAAFAITMVFAWPHVKRDWAAIRAKLWLLLGYGAFGMGLFNLLLYSAPHFTTALNMSMEQAAIPILVLAGNFVLFRVRTSALQLVGVALTVWGVALVATHGDPGRLLSLTVNLGDALTLAACVLYAGYSLALRYRPDIHWLSFLAATFAGAALTAILAVVVFGGWSDFAPGAISPTGWLIVAYTATLPSIGAQFCYAVSVVRVGPNRASLFINLIPVFGTVLAIILLGEALEAYHLVAAAFVVVGIGLAEFTARSRPEVPPA